MPVPKRGQVLLEMRNALVQNLEPLGKLVALEMGKYCFYLGAMKN